ncbi:MULTISPECIES: tetratricopeptide repeat protein [Paraburkholderia]|uniref:tetratricopeptide repeat protein n=1 Tax=Paraburkholderia TaxID=1822464 RepID=UPI0038B80036
MQDDTLQLLISIGHYACAHRCFDEARFLFGRLGLLYPQRAFPYIGLGLVELNQANYRAASRLLGRAVDLAPDNSVACAWLGACQLAEGHYALGTRTLMAVPNDEDPSAFSMATALLKLPECAPYTRAARAAQTTRGAALFSTIERLTIRGGH